MRNDRLNQTTYEFSELIPDTLTTLEEDFYEGNMRILNQFLNESDEAETSQIYKLFYSFNAEQQIKADC